jgi:hypothetical protein
MGEQAFIGDFLEIAKLLDRGQASVKDYRILFRKLHNLRNRIKRSGE